MAKQKGAEAPHKPLMVDAASMTEPVRELQPPDPDWRATLLHVFALCAVQVGINVAIMVFIYTGDEVTEHVYVLAALWMMFIYSVLLPISILRFVFIVKDHKVLRIFLRGLLTVVDMLSVPLLASLARMVAELPPRPNPTRNTPSPNTNPHATLPQGRQERDAFDRELRPRHRRRPHRKPWRLRRHVDFGALQAGHRRAPLRRRGVRVHLPAQRRAARRGRLRAARRADAGEAHS
uniref:Uncharacterized protein n=1 Tax=Phaeomonas parva TaxID=124430 RepID=A0A7S1U4V9_9STRA|mmetsp:Transcript_28911/g.92388  ORF Transcript_28911/g.92388 Transcript_28911/m.92388 type:complete len:235 (+) Transcript_28911:239-943(+)